MVLTFVAVPGVLSCESFRLIEGLDKMRDRNFIIDAFDFDFFFGGVGSGRNIKFNRFFERPFGHFFGFDGYLYIVLANMKWVLFGLFQKLKKVHFEAFLKIFFILQGEKLLLL